MGFFNKIFGKKKKEEELESINENIENVEKLDNTEPLEDERAENKENEVEISEIKEKKLEEKKLEEKKEIEPESLIIKERDNKNITETEKKSSEGFFASFTSLKEKLFRTREGLFGKIKNIFSGKTVIDEELYEELEDLLIQSDIGMDMTIKIVNSLEKEVKSRGIKEPAEIYSVLKDVMSRFLIDGDNKLDIREGELNVILVVGVNGVGKTTTIGKIAKKLKASGKKVIIGAADTFRAAAVEQLEEWGKRADVEVIKKDEGSDPGAVVYDTIQVGLDKKADVVIIDTAGRLHNKNNLMKELEKINNIIIKKLGHSRYESILIIDGTTGQNGLTQAKVFNEATKLTGFIVTKLDGTAKGGIVFSISEEIKKPIKYIGVGEKIDDLREFNTKDYIEAIFD